MKRNMLAQRLGSLLVIRQNSLEATDEDWDELLKFLSENREELTHIRIFVYTDGGIVTAAQRKRLAQTLGEAHMLVAAVSDSIKVRFAGSTIALFQRNYRQFSVSEMAQAYQHLNLTLQERRQVEATMKELERALYPDGKGK